MSFRRMHQLDAEVLLAEAEADLITVRGWSCGEPYRAEWLVACDGRVNSLRGLVGAKGDWSEPCAPPDSRVVISESVS